MYNLYENIIFYYIDKNWKNQVFIYNHGLLPPLG